MVIIVDVSKAAEILGIDTDASELEILTAYNNLLCFGEELTVITPAKNQLLLYKMQIGLILTL